MRQAYDYWQDQPGNYFPSKYTSTPNERTVLIPYTCHQPSLVTFLVRSSSLIQRAIPTTTSEMHSAGPKLTNLLSNPKLACQTTLVPRSHKFLAHSTLSPLQCNKLSWHSQGTTKHQHPTKICTRWSRWFPESLICFGLGHRQVVHNPSSMQAFYYLTFHLSHSTLKSSDPPQTSLACQTGVSMARSRIT